ncbi:YbhB/YbcL family Raf kinase inhibitor-like protein [Methanobacterium oryzae]|uniref:YbhB/YbcL family Raf kinase inhibitor-like protein n=1 Tax=Methanobacterium oryzae TaxID=69540 RepID=UPI003D198CA9
MTIAIASEIFSEGSVIPLKYTCDGENISPPLRWDLIPENTASFALLCEDPDAPGGTFIHWILFNIPADTKELLSGIKEEKKLDNGAIQGKNDFERIGYGGPCPPSGTKHRFIFKILALDTVLNLKSGITIDQFLNAIQGHVLDKGELIGMYGK